MAKLGALKERLGVVPAILLAAVATIALAAYIRGIEARALRGTQPVNAFVAKETIPNGTTGANVISRGLVVRTAIPRRFVAEGAIGSLDDIRDKVATATILKGEQILAGRFAVPSATRGLLPIPEDRQAFSIEVPTSSGVSGFVRSGDRVSILAQVDAGAPGGQADVRVQYLLQDVVVLAVGRRGGAQQGIGAQNQGGDKVLLTVAVTPPEAEKLAFAILQGQIYVTLKPAEQEPAGTPGRNRQNLFS